MNIPGYESTEPQVVERSMTEYQLALGFLAEQIVTNAYDSDDIYTDLFSVMVSGGFSDEYYHHLDYPEFYTQHELIVSNLEFYEDQCYGNRANVYAEIPTEIIDLYRKAVGDADASSEIEQCYYKPPNSRDCPNTRYTWALKLLVENLMSKDFNPYAFPRHESDDFNITLEGYDFGVLIKANMRNT